MIKRPHVKHLQAGSHRAALGVVGSVSEPRDASLYQCARTHRARLDGHVESGATQAVIAHCGSGRAKSDDFRMRRGIAVADGAIAGRTDHAIFEHHHCANGDFSPDRGGLRLLNRHMHVFVVGHVRDAGAEEIECSTTITSWSPSFNWACAEWRPTSRQPVARHTRKPSRLMASTL